jgi:hypothetical protein
MANPSAPGKKYVELSVHVWYDQSVGKVMITSTDPDLPKGLILPIKRGIAADTVTRALLANYGKMPSGA